MRNKQAMTLRQWQWFYADRMLAACEQRGMGDYYLRDALQRMDVPEFHSIEFGTGMQVASSGYREMLPLHSVVQTGNPKTWSGLGVFVKQSHSRWTPLLGELEVLQSVRNYQPQPVTVLLVGGKVVEQDWITQTPTSEDQAAAQKFQIQAWKVGLDIKREQGWCPEYESTLLRATGMTSEVLRVLSYKDRSVGDEVSPAETLTLPIGTVLCRATQGPERSSWYQRTALAANAAGTVRVMGWGDSRGAFARAMRIVSFPSADGADHEGIDVGMYRPEVWNAMPPGTVVLWQNSRYIMHADHRLREEHSRYGLNDPGRFNQHDFGTNIEQMRVISFPTERQAVS